MNTPQRDSHTYEVYVGNIGHVCTLITANENMARKEANDWIRQSKMPFGRASGESVTLMRDDEILKEYTPCTKNDC